MGYTTCIQSFDFQGITLKNVIAAIPGADTTTGSVTVGAHYDSRPFKGLAPGAVDNGSGTAVMLAMAKAYKDSGVLPVKTVYFVGFAGEEPGLAGSKEFAEKLKL